MKPASRNVLSDVVAPSFQAAPPEPRLRDCSSRSSGQCRATTFQRSRVGAAPPSFSAKRCQPPVGSVGAGLAGKLAACGAATNRKPLLLLLGCGAPSISVRVGWNLQVSVSDGRLRSMWSLGTPNNALQRTASGRSRSVLVSDAPRPALAGAELRR